MHFLSTITGSFAMPADENPTVAMVEAAYAHHGIDARYLNCEVAPSSLAAAEPAKQAQKTFPSAKAAADALVTAAEKYDVDALKAILGPDGIDLVVTEDAVQDRNEAAAFAANAREKLAVMP